jgi:glycosyltransferase involved in cell wall biosynthesis
MTATVVAAQAARGQPVDVVYVREAICAGWWVGLWGPLLKLPVIYEAHDLESWNPSRAKERWVQPLLHLLDRVALGRSAVVVSLTEDFRRLLARLGWRVPDDVAVIPDAFDSQQIGPGDKQTARDALGIEADTALLVYAGMTFSYRNLDKLLEALASVRAIMPNVQLALVGGRKGEITALQAHARGLGLDGVVRWLGQQPQAEVARWLHAADVLAIPDTVTDVTASPLKLFEYLAAGRAVVLPDIPALKEILPPSTGYYFRRGDAAGMAEAISDALTDPAREQREAAGQALVASHTYAERAQRILALTTKVAGKYQK